MKGENKVRGGTRACSAPPGFAAKFTLVNTSEKLVTDDVFLGNYTLVYFGFTHCKVVCPRSLNKLSSVIDRLRTEKFEVKAIYITVDPERDTPEVMRRYLMASYPAFEGLTGTIEQIEEAKDAFRIFAERKTDPDDPDGYEVPHTAIAYLIDPEGEYCGHYPDHLDEDRVFDRIKAILAARET
ncbi:MAG: SCO family protein [Gammaproteobacteria bacterium]|jgi:protein SCO1/2